MSARRRKKKKSYFLPVIFLFFVLSAVAYNVFPSVREKVDNYTGIFHLSQGEADESGLIPSETAVNLPPDEDKTLAAQGITVYDILGESLALDATQWGNMLAMRYEAKKLATKYPDTVFINGKPSSKSVCLTFDDGPDESITSQIIDVLDAYKVKGNFFFVGKNIAKYPEVTKKAFDSGHLIACHSFNHSRFTDMDYTAVKSEIEKTNDEIERLTGKRPQLVRPPFGAIDDDVILAMKQDGYRIILWSGDTLDWSQKEADNIVKNVMDNVRPGEIILMHSSSGTEETLKALPILIEKLKEKSFEITTLDKLIQIEAYK